MSSDKPPSRVDKLGERRVFDGFFKLDEARFRFERFDGEMSAEVRRLILKRGDAVAAVLFDIEAQALVLTRQFRYPAYDNGDGWLIELVAGMVDPGEGPETAIRREIAEETGHEPFTLEHIRTFYSSPGGVDERIILFFAQTRAAAVPAHGKADEHEDIETILVSAPQAREMIDKGEIVDAKTIIGLEWWLARQDGAA